MGWMDRMAGWLSRKDSAVGPLLALNRVGRPVWSGRNYRGYAKEAYTENPVAHRCIALIATNTASIVPLVYQGKSELSDHEALTVLAQPNPWQSGPELMEALISYFLIAGDGFLEAVTLDDRLRELYALRPDRMRAVAGRRGYPQAWKYTVDGTTSHTFEMDLGPDKQLPILHLKSFNPLDDWGGLSPVAPAAFSIDVFNAAGSYNKALLDNSASPSGALVYKGGDDGKGSLPEQEFNRLKRELKERFSGRENAGRPMLLDGGLEWAAMGMSPKDMEFTMGKREAAREIALAFGVPPMLLGIPGDNTYSNFKEANAALYKQTVLPLADKVFAALTNWLQPTYPDVRIGYDLDKVQGLAADREATWKQVQEADFITIDEKRDATGYGEYKPEEDKPGGTILVNGTMMPLDEAAFQPGGAEPPDPAAPKPAKEPAKPDA